MLKNLFIMRDGNKQNDIKFFIDLLPLDKKIIVEPFGGTFAIIRNVYYNDHYKKIVSDNDESFMNDILLLKNDYKKHEAEYKEYYELFNNNNYKMKDFKELLKEKYNNDSDIINYNINKYNFRGYFKIQKKQPDYKKISLFLENVNIYICEYIETMDKYKYNEDAFLFCDPPYLNSANMYYTGTNSDVNKDNTHIFIYLKKYIKKCTCKIMIIVNDNSIMRYLFKKYIKMSYTRTYQRTKRRCKHLVITNY